MELTKDLYTKEEVKEIIFKVKDVFLNQELLRLDNQFDCLDRFEKLADALDPTANAHYKKIKCDQAKK